MSMKHRNWLIAATLGEVLLVVGVLAGYLTAIAAILRRVSRTLGQVTFGVRAIERMSVGSVAWVAMVCLWGSDVAVHIRRRLALFKPQC